MFKISAKPLTISTVYRTLELLQEFNLVSVIDTGDRQAKYVHVHDHTPHLHLVCKKCGHIEGIHLEDIKDAAKDIEEKLNFQIDWQDVTLHGLCEACREKEKLDQYQQMNGESIIQIRKH